jgi:hypothetical protein
MEVLQNNMEIHGLSGKSSRSGGLSMSMLLYWWLEGKLFLGKTSGMKWL